MKSEAIRTGTPFKAMFYPWVVVALALGAQAAAACASQGLPVLYPFVQTEFGLSRAQVGLITSALMGGGGVTVFVGGWLADVVGVKRVMTTILLCTGVLMGAFYLAHSFPMVLGLAVFIGAVESPGYPATTRAIMDWLPRRVLGFVMSLKQTGVPLAGAVAAAIAPAVAAASGWRAASAALGTFAVFVSLMFLFFYRDTPRGHEAPTRIGFATFRTLSRNRSVVLTTAWGIVFVGLQFIVLSYFVLFLVERAGASPVVAGGLLATAQTGSIVARIFWGTASDFAFRSRRGTMLGILGMLTAAAFFSVSLVDANSPGVVLVLVAIFLGVTTLSWHGVFTAHVGETVGAAQTGTALGAISTLQRVGMVGFPPLFGLLADLSGSYITGWRVGAALATITAIAMLVLGREARKRGAPATP